SGIAPTLVPLSVQAAKDKGQRLSLCPEDVAREIARVHEEQPDPDYPLRLVSRRLLECLNSLYTDSPHTRRRYATNFAYMNPQDIAAGSGVEDGGKVEISSRYGSLTARVKADQTVPPGVISMCHQWGGVGEGADGDSGQGSLTARLVSLEHEVEPINRMPRQSAIAVRVRQVAGVAAT
ncbi:MAG: molybdopterin dinucleotide binding domain-containing protein, partial [Parahaliea sp.]